jgi:hypothetical protein
VACYRDSFTFTFVTEEETELKEENANFRAQICFSLYIIYYRRKNGIFQAQKGWPLIETLGVGIEKSACLSMDPRQRSPSREEVTFLKSYPFQNTMPFILVKATQQSPPSSRSEGKPSKKPAESKNPDDGCDTSLQDIS